MADNGQSDEPKFPKCPGCGTQPLNFVHSHNALSSGALISIIWCKDCGHVFNMVQVGQTQPIIARPEMKIAPRPS